MPIRPYFNGLFIRIQYVVMLEKPATYPTSTRCRKKSVQPEKPIEELLLEAQAKIEEQREAMLRAVADADNVRKRAQAEGVASQKYAVERFAENLLPVMDSLLAALQSKDVSGVELTLRQLKAALRKPASARSTPSRASASTPTGTRRWPRSRADAEPNTIIAVMQKGYLLHDRRSARPS
jgi:molecular chaperone GrpE